jgi:hypothetical protein
MLVSAKKLQNTCKKLSKTTEKTKNLPRTQKETVF